MKVKPIPDGFHAVTPYLVVKDAAKQIEFMKKAFDAEVVYRMDTPMGTTHAELKIRDSHIMIGQARAENAPLPTMLYLYVVDADKAYDQAIKAGGISIQEPADQFYGDRSGAVKDINDNQWWVATRKENLSEEELAKRAQEFHGKQKVAK